MQYKKIFIKHFVFILGLCLIDALQKTARINIVSNTVTTKITAKTAKITSKPIKLTTLKMHAVNATLVNNTHIKRVVKDSDILKIENKTAGDNNKFKDTRRKKNKKKERSTSSSSGSESDDKSTQTGKESLEMTTSSSSSEEFEDRSYTTPRDSIERKGWRKWHRKCDRCEEDMKKKWRDHSISWICGAYQRARRTFKSECMMHYRNCQDGTMFVKLHDHKCKNDSYHGYHFFYDYKVDGSDKSSSSGSSSDSESSSTGDSSGFDIESVDTNDRSGSFRPKKKITKFMDITARVLYT